MSLPFSLPEPGAFETSAAHAWEKGILGSDGRMIPPPNKIMSHARGLGVDGVLSEDQEENMFATCYLISAFTEQYCSGLAAAQLFPVT